jgi:hypothetical protein
MPLPTQVTQHKAITTTNNHGVVAFTFTSGSPAFTGMTSDDLYKLSFRTADNRLFIVSAINSGVGTWHQIALIDDVVLLGETSTTAYRGDRGKIAYDHTFITSGNPHSVTKAEVGLGNCDNTSDANKPISTATQTALDKKQLVFAGIDESTPVTVSINYTTRVLTATPVGSNFVFYTDGSNGVITRHVKTGAVDFPAFTDTTGLWHFYFDSSGNPQSNQAMYDFFTSCPVYRLTWNSTKSPDSEKSITEFIEYHDNSISVDDHIWKHANGTIWISGFNAIHYALASGIGNDSGLNTCFSLTSGVCMDDNLLYSVTNSTDASEWNQDLGITTAGSLTNLNSGIFNIRYKGVGGEPELVTGTRFPFLWDSGTDRPQYVDTNGTRTLVTDDNFFVYFVYSIQDKRTGQSVRLTPSYAQYASLTAAQAVTWANVQAQDPGANDNEIRVLYRLIFQFSNSGMVYPVENKYSVLREVTDLRKIIITQASNIGGTLPASNITYTPTSPMTSTNVQSVLNEILTGRLYQLPIYANNAAAIAGGKIAGDLYRTSADPSLVAQVY